MPDARGRGRARWRYGVAMVGPRPSERRAGRDDFPADVKRELADRVGGRCSAPNCRAPTHGPSESRVSGVSSVGLAAHITAASPGGPRYDASLTSEQRRGIDNGIWLCQNHGKQIDDDESRWTSTLLRAWRAHAETRASDEQGRPSVALGDSRDLVTLQRRLDLGQSVHLLDQINAFLIDVGAPHAWGKLCDISGMLLFEMAANAVAHGGATSVTVVASESSIAIENDGRLFEIADLRHSGRGGHKCLLDFEKYAAGDLLLVSDRIKGVNRWTIIDQIATGGRGNPCSVFVEGATAQHAYASAAAAIQELDTCGEIHLYPQGLWSHSLWFIFARHIREPLGDRRLIVHGLDDELFGDLLTGLLPNVTLMPSVLSEDAL